jgi:hypothetical protein
MSGIYQKIWETRWNHPQKWPPSLRGISGGSYESRAGGRKFERIHVWVNYNELTATSLEIMVSKGNQWKSSPNGRTIQVSEIL